MKILIAEDEIVSRLLLESTLKNSGHEVTAVRNGLEAIELLKVPSRFQVIISDWKMPEVDGLELCRRIRAKQGEAYVYFVLLTALDAEKNNLREAMDAGIDDFLTKPIDPEAIWMRLRVAERILGYTARIGRLESLLPICMYCSKVRNDKDYWQQIDSYVHQHTGMTFSHGVCPECYANKVRPELDALKSEVDGQPA
jgi:phosphoserine phosphatase RsbU/P